MSPQPTSPQPCLTAGWAGSHLVGVCIAGGGGILSLRLIHGPLGRPHGCILGCLLHMRVPPRPRGPLLLSFAETPPTAPVEFMNLWEEEHRKGLIKRKRQAIKERHGSHRQLAVKASPASHPCSVHQEQSPPSHSTVSPWEDFWVLLSFGRGVATHHSPFPKPTSHP